MFQGLGLSGEDAEARIEPGGGGVDLLGERPLATGNLGALELGERRLCELLDDVGDDTVAAAIAEMGARAARQMRAIIADLPDGTVSFEDHIDNDGITDEPIRIALDLTVAGDRLTLDFSRSAPACTGPMNVSRATTIAFRTAASSGRSSRASSIPVL